LTRLFRKLLSGSEHFYQIAKKVQFLLLVFFVLGYD
jgi:hypothetical protein